MSGIGRAFIRNEAELPTPTASKFAALLAAPRRNRYRVVFAFFFEARSLRRNGDSFAGGELADAAIGAGGGTWTTR